MSFYYRPTLLCDFRNNINNCFICLHLIVSSDLLFMYLRLDNCGNFIPIWIRHTIHTYTHIFTLSHRGRHWFALYVSIFEIFTIFWRNKDTVIWSWLVWTYLIHYKWTSLFLINIINCTTLTIFIWFSSSPFSSPLWSLRLRRRQCPVGITSEYFTL